MVKELKYYSLSELIRIAIFRVTYKLELAACEYKLRLFPKKWTYALGQKNIDYNAFAGYYAHCDSEISAVVDEANNILQGKIVLFGKLCEIDPKHGWLNDPVTGGLWNKNAYFVAAPVKQDGLADVKFVLELNKFNHLVRVSLAYYYTHNKRYIQFIIDSIDGYRETVKPYHSIVQRIIMDMGFRIINLIQILLLCKDDDEFQKRTAPQINGIIFDLVKAMEQFHTAKWFKTGNGANHVTGEMVGLILGQLWLQHNGVANYESKYKKEYAYLVEVLNRTIAPSGAYLEQSGNYSRLVSEFLIVFDLLKECMGHKGYCKVYEEGHFRERILQYLRDISYNDHVPNFGDNDDARVLTAFCGQKEQVEYILRDIKPSCCSEAYLDGSQWTFSSQDENDVHLFARVGKFAFFREGASIHAHNDLLAVLLSVKGQPVFVDKGMCYYNSGSDLRKSYSQIVAHNTISIEGVEMTQLGVGVSFQYPLCEYVKDDIHDSVIFSGYLKYGDVEHKRTIFYQSGRIEIEDFVQMTNNNVAKGSIHFLLNHQIKANKDGEDIVLSLPKGSNVRVNIHGADTVELLSSDYSPAYGQNVKTTMIMGEFRANEKIRIKSIIVT